MISKLIRLFYWGMLLLTALISLSWLFKAQTLAGMGVAVVGLSLVSFPALLILRDQRQISKRSLKRGGIFMFVVLISIIASILLLTPTGNPAPNSPVRHRFLGNGAFKRYALTNIIPEIEQVNLGFVLMPYLDPILTTEQVHEVSGLTMRLYREMEQDDNFHELGSVMGESYAQAFGLPVDTDHYYLYIPQHAPGKPLPAIVFLHGSAGNFKTYTWVWSKLAEEQGVVIIAPSYGFGNWDQASIPVVLQAIEDARQVVDIDSEQIYLAGLSNGGVGVSRLASAMPELFRGLIFISPVMATDIVDGTDFQEKWAQRPILVLAGAVDQRVPVSYVEQRVARLSASGAAVTSIVYPQADHFLFFAQSDRILDDVSFWLAQVNQ